MPITVKRYACTRCGNQTTQATNHFGPTWSAGHYNACYKCPPWAKWPEYGGQTVRKRIEPLAKFNLAQVKDIISREPPLRKCAVFWDPSKQVSFIDFCDQPQRS